MTSAPAAGVILRWRREAVIRERRASTEAQALMKAFLKKSKSL
jgi:hypothetical protein